MGLGTRVPYNRDGEPEAKAMSQVVTAFSWAGWIWTGLFLLVVIPLLLRQARLRRQGVPAPVAPDAPSPHAQNHG